MIALHGDETGSRDVAARPEAPEVETCTSAGWVEGPQVESPYQVGSGEVVKMRSRTNAPALDPAENAEVHLAPVDWRRWKCARAGCIGRLLALERLVLEGHPRWRRAPQERHVLRRQPIRIIH